MNIPSLLPARKLKARIASVLKQGRNHPETEVAERLALEFEGVPGSRHHGFLRKAGPREPWYARGTPMRSGRQISLVSVEDLDFLAQALMIDRLDAGWLGADVVVAGIPSFSWLPAGTRLAAASGAVLVVEGQNAPCRVAGRAVARHLPEERRTDVELGFAKVAAGNRGLVASVERPGALAPGDALDVRIGRQWIYDPDDGAQGRLF